VEKKILMVGIITAGGISWSSVGPFSGIISCNSLELKFHQLPDAPELIGLSSSENWTGSFGDFKGKVVLCSLDTQLSRYMSSNLAKLKQVTSRLDDNSDDVAVLMVTTDPKRDTPEQ